MGEEDGEGEGGTEERKEEGNSTGKEEESKENQNKDDHAKKNSDNGKVIENDDNDDKDSGIGNENFNMEEGGVNGGKNSAKSSAKNSERSKGLKDMSDSDTVNKNKKNIRRNSEMPVVSTDEYENLQEALERFNSLLLDQPVEGKDKNSFLPITPH